MTTPNSSVSGAAIRPRHGASPTGTRYARTTTWTRSSPTSTRSRWRCRPPCRPSWRRDKGGLWDIGPHALSLLLPVLGPVTEVAARTGPRDTTHLLLGHRDGAASTLSVTLDAAPAASVHEVAFHGDRGFATVPRGEGGPVEAFTAAIDQLRDTAAEGRADHPCDVRFGREVVAILEAAESARREGRTVRPLPAPPAR